MRETIELFGISFGISVGIKGRIDKGLSAYAPKGKGKKGVSPTTGQLRVHSNVVQHGLLRPLRAAELSDGTLRYLLLAVALLTPRPPPLLVLNEPETSLHPSLFGPLARLIAKVAERSQVIVVSHATALVDALKDQGLCASYELKKELGETIIEDLEAPIWAWRLPACSNP